MATAAPTTVTNPPNPQVPTAATPAQTQVAAAPTVNPATNPQVNPNPRPPIVQSVTVGGQIRNITVNGVRITNPADFNNIASALLREREVEAKYANIKSFDPLFSESIDASIAATNAVLAAGTVALNNVRAGSAPPGGSPPPVAPAANPQIPPAATPAAATPATAPPAVVPAANPQVPTLPGFTATTVTNVNEGKFRAENPQAYTQFKAYEAQQQKEEVGRLTALTEQKTGKNFLTAKERSIVTADAATLAREAAIKQFSPQILAAGAGVQTTTQGPTGQVPIRTPGAVASTTGFVDNAAGAATGIRRQPAAPQAAGTNNARQQAPIQAQTSQLNTADWRVRLKLAPQSQYLYNASQPGILQPLKVTNGIIFPYTPQISTQYQANYSPYNLTHSNFKGYFYQGSNTGEVKITATFTAQDTSEANYLLAVIHFFRSATKMFYGATDAFRGAPPPLVFLSGLGEYQFNNHPCVIQSFDYTLPADVDYIRANSSNNTGTTLTQNRDRQNLPVNSNNPSGNRLQTAGLTPGGIPVLPAPTPIGTTAPTYVPTKMEISIVLLPMQTRIQVSQQFSMEKFANGNLLKGGFW
jgi:hypothetical protein